MRLRKVRLVLVLVFSLVGIEIISSLALHVLNVSFGAIFQPVNQLPDTLKERILKSIDFNTTNLHKIDPHLGWVVQPNVDLGSYITNADAVRSQKEVTPSIPVDRFRWGTFGDSFTFGDEVDNTETWQSQTELINPEFEFLNFGVGGYSIDQAYLRYQKQSKIFDFSGVIIGVQSRDIFEVANTFRPFSLPETSAPFTKPRYVIESGNLILLENPLPDRKSYLNLLSHPAIALDAVGKRDYYYQRKYKDGPYDFLNSVRLYKILADEIDIRIFDRGILREAKYDKNSETYAIADKILRSFYEEVQQTGATPVIVFLPNKRDINKSRSGADVSYAPLRDELIKDGFKVIDPQKAFETSDAIEALIGGHYTALGNLRLAQYLSYELSGIIR